ncbi:uncharacterized protein LOC144169984 isoform X1 [Haemaphysalis longicornis]
MACSSLPARALQNYQHPTPAAPARAWRHHQHEPSTVLAVKEHAAEKHHFQLLRTTGRLQLASLLKRRGAACRRQPGRGSRQSLATLRPRAITDAPPPEQRLLGRASAILHGSTCLQTSAGDDRAYWNTTSAGFGQAEAGVGIAMQ